MSQDIVGDTVRAARRERRFGKNPVCILCGRENPEALTEVNRTLLEKHHIAGRATDESLIVIVCLCCHRVLTEGQLLEALDFQGGTNLLESLVNVLRGLATFFTQLAEHCRSRADRLVELILRFDREYPGLRDLLEAAR
jgi:hypothetical protein